MVLSYSNLGVGSLCVCFCFWLSFVLGYFFRILASEKIILFSYPNDKGLKNKNESELKMD